MMAKAQGDLDVEFECLNFTVLSFCSSSSSLSLVSWATNGIQELECKLCCWVSAEKLEKKSRILRGNPIGHW